ncbi:hypothetical protein XANCAGTX0491_001350 [Xanthoria calcicola]
METIGAKVAAVSTKIKNAVKAEFHRRDAYEQIIYEREVIERPLQQLTELGLIGPPLKPRKGKGRKGRKA